MALVLLPCLSNSNLSEEVGQVELNCNFLASNDLITTMIYHDSNDWKKLTPFSNVLTSITCFYEFIKNWVIIVVLCLISLVIVIFYFTTLFELLLSK